MCQFKQVISTLGAGLVLLSCSFLIGFEAPSQSRVQNTRLKPFVLYERELQFSADNLVQKEVEYTVARRADGSWMKSFMMKDPLDRQEGKAVLIWDVARHQSIMLEPFTKSVMTQHWSDAEIADFVRSESCAGIVLPEAKQPITAILGHPVLQATEKSDMSESASWRAPDLDCYPLETTIHFLGPKFKGVYQTKTVTRIDEGPPPDSLFVVPAEYTERSPLELEKEFITEFPGHVVFGPDGAASTEHQYRKHQIAK